jgi:hypothetical protein
VFPCEWCEEPFRSHKARTQHLPACREFALAHLHPGDPRPYYCLEAWGSGSVITLRLCTPDTNNKGYVKAEGYQTYAPGAAFRTLHAALVEAATRRRAARKRVERQLEHYLAKYRAQHLGVVSDAQGKVLQTLHDAPNVHRLAEYAGHVERLRRLPYPRPPPPPQTP